VFFGRKGIDRGIFGLNSTKRSEIHGLVELLESRNPTPDPTDKLQDKVRYGIRIFINSVVIKLKCLTADLVALLSFRFFLTENGTLLITIISIQEL
jgi:hypothetical protein